MFGDGRGVIENNNIHSKLNAKLDKPNLFLDN